MDPNKFKRNYRYKSDASYRESKRNKIMIALGFAIVVLLYLLLG